MHALMLYSAYNHSKDRRMSYWDIHEFLAEEEKVEFSISQDAHLIDFLDPTKEGAIPADTTITTAIWLLNTLSDYLDAPSTSFPTQTPKLKSAFPKTTAMAWKTGTPPSKRPGANSSEPPPNCPTSTRSTKDLRRRLPTRSGRYRARSWEGYWRSGQN